MNKTHSFVFGVLAASIVVTGCSTRQDPSSPILILASQENFGLFTAEILRTEGFNDFTVDSIGGAHVNKDYLLNFDIVILAKTSIDASVSLQLRDFVSGGGNLVAFQPDKRLSDVFGLDDEGVVIEEGYIVISEDSPVGKGLTKETLQFHGEADAFKLVGSKSVARLFDREGKATPYPAVVENVYGSGRAIAFLYNLPESIVLTRQGNPRDAGKEMDGILGIRAMDLFTNEWVDTSKNVLNQADEQMRLLSHCIEHLTATAKPLPRFWYFPDTLKCIVTLNNDGEDSKEAEFTPQFQDVDAKGAMMTLYIKEVEFVSRNWTDSWRRKGYEISGHPDDTKQATDPDWQTMDSVYKALQKELKETFGVDSMHTVTNHWFVWVGRNEDGTNNFAAQAKIEELNGVGLDCNYAHYDNGSSHGHFLGAFGTRQGNYTGSGLPMKFADVNGSIINVYQQLNNVYDQQYMEHKDQEGYYNAFKGLMDRSLDDEIYSTICVRAHNNEYFFSKIPLMKALDYANERGVPVWTEHQLLKFLKMKDAASFKNLNRSGNTVSFDIISPVSGDNMLTCIIPSTFQGEKIRRIVNNGKEQTFSVKPMKGFEYAWITVKPGARYSLEVEYQ